MLIAHPQSVREFLVYNGIVRTLVATRRAGAPKAVLFVRPAYAPLANRMYHDLVRDGAVLGFPAYDADKNLVGLYRDQNGAPVFVQVCTTGEECDPSAAASESGDTENPTTHQPSDCEADDAEGAEESPPSPPSPAAMAAAQRRATRAITQHDAPVREKSTRARKAPRRH